MSDIKFGTDGWRGIIAEDFTFDNLRLVVQAIMSYLLKRTGQPAISVGYDNRFMSERNAVTVAEVAAGNGANVTVCRVPVTTPMLSYYVKSTGADGGIMVTASHNPYYFNGIKFKAPYGGSATPAIVREIESLIGKSQVLSMPYGKCREEGLIIEVDFFDSYSNGVLGCLDLETLRRFAPKTVLDCMHGSAGHHAARLWDSADLELKVLRDDRNPFFGGISPEPLEKNLGRLMSEVAELGFDMGVATDGDADRLVVVDGNGEYVTPHRLFALLLLHLHNNRGLSGVVVKTVSTSVLIDRIAMDLGLRVIETPVGFKHICELMLTEDVLIGGEENGGIGVKGYIPERDGLFISLMILEMLSVEGKGISELLSEVDKRYGKLYYKRHDEVVEGHKRQNLCQEISARAGDVYRDFDVKGISESDGLKVHFKDGSWILFRPSGTEPILRIYAESADPGLLDKIMDTGREAFVG